jgi:hypothetical protein
MKKILLTGFVLGALVLSLLNTDGSTQDIADENTPIQTSAIKVGG